MSSKAGDESRQDEEFMQVAACVAGNTAATPRVRLARVEVPASAENPPPVDGSAQTRVFSGSVHPFPPLADLLSPQPIGDNLVEATESSPS